MRPIHNCLRRIFFCYLSFLNYYMINWGIIGCGDVTEVKSGPAFSKIPGSKLVAVMRRDAIRAEDYARRHGVARWYSNADDLLNDPEVNAIYIATPPAYHLMYAQEALSRGLHVYVEKPVTLNASEAKAMAIAVSLSKAKLVVAHYRRAVPLFLQIRNLLQQKRIGDIRTVHIRLWQASENIPGTDNPDNWRLQPEISGGGYFHDLAPHQIDLLVYYFGLPFVYQGFSVNQSLTSGADDNVCGQIIFGNKVLVNGSWSFNVDKEEECDLCEIIGTRGSIRFAFFGKFITLRYDGVEETTTFIHPQHIEQPMIEQAVAYFNGQQENPCSIEQALVTMNIMDKFTNKA